MSFFKPTLPHIYMTANIRKVRRVPLQSSNDRVNSFPGSLATHSSLTSDNTYYHNLPICPVLVPVESWDSSLCVNKFLACLHTGLCPTHHARTRKATKKKIPHTYNSSENWIFFCNASILRQNDAHTYIRIVRSLAGRSLKVHQKIFFFCECSHSVSVSQEHGS